jgi:hypothetical protein
MLFFYGRNGMDAFGYTTWALSFIIMIVASFVAYASEIAYFILFIIETALLVYTVFRAMSRNLVKRRRENAWILSVFAKIKGFFALQKNKFRDRKTHVYKKCPSCKKVLRLPKKKGEHTVNCPVCHNRFDLLI